MMLGRPITVLLFIFFTLFAIGSATKIFLPASSLTIASTECFTSVQVVRQAGLTAPELHVTGLNGALETYVKFDTATNRLTISSINAAEVVEDESSEDGDSPSGASRATSLFGLLTATLALFFGITLKGKLRFVVLVLVVVFGCYSNGAIAQCSYQYQVILILPTTAGYVYNSLTVSIDAGSFTATNSDFNYLSITQGQLTSVAGDVTLTTVNVRNTLSIRIKGNANITTLGSLSNAVATNINSKSATVSYANFFGTATTTHVAASVVTLTGAHCAITKAATTSKSICSPRSLASLVVTVSANVSINFGSGTSATYREPDAVDIVPSNPGVSSTVPSQTYAFGSSKNWIWRDQWTPQNITKTADPTEISVVQAGGGNWRGNVWWAVCDEALPALAKGAAYSVSFKVKLNETVAMAGVQVAFFINPSYKGYYSLPPATLTDPAEASRWLSISSEITNAALNSATYTTLTGSLSVTKDFYSGVWAWDRNNYWENPPTTNLNKYYVALAIRFNQTKNTEYKPATFFIKDVTVTQNSYTFVAPAKTDFTATSEIFVARKPSTTLDSNTRGATCPWTDATVKLWHNPSTWPGNVLPNPSSVITIPDNTKVLVTSSIPFNYDEVVGGTPTVYNKWLIPPTSEVIFADARINLHIKNIEVQGKLRIGSPTCRVYSPISITFYGASTTADDLGQFMGSKGVSAHSGGELQVHGKQFHFTWTRLAAPAYGGTDRIYLQDSVNWQIGQQVVISTTFYKDQWYPQNEVLTIKGIDSAKKIIQFTEPLKYFHYAGAEYQAEVGLLTRTVQFIGNEADSESTGFGGHVIIAGTGKGQLSGVQAIRMGQRNRLARYPFHMHNLQQTGSASSFKDLSCYHTYFRCITIHATHNALITRNVGYDITGNAVYLEDGVEENNTVSYNLIVDVKVIDHAAAGAAQGGETVLETAALSQPADITASAYYITNAYNRYIGNAASGGWAGYSFPNLYLPIGLSRNIIMDPSSRNLLEFDGNTAHSAGYYWGSGSCIYVGGRLRYAANNVTLEYLSGRIERETRQQLPTETQSASNKLVWNSGSSPKYWMRFNNTKVFLCQNGLNHWGNRPEIFGYEAHDITRSTTLFGEAWLGKAIINGQSANPITGLPTRQAFQFYDTYVKTLVTNTNFRNYNPTTAPPYSNSDNKVIISMVHSDKFKPQGISAVRGITYTNVNRNVTLGHRIENTGASRYYNFVDFDGSATYSAGPTIVGSHMDWWKLANNCVKEWDVWRCPKLPGMEIGNLFLLVPGIIESDPAEPPHYTSNHVGLTYLWGDGLSLDRSCPVTTLPGITGITNRGWYMYLNNNSTVGIAPKKFTINTYLIPQDTYIMFAINYPSGTTFNITNQQWSSPRGGSFTTVASLAALKASNGTVYYWSGSTLYLKLVNGGITNPLTNYPFFERDGARLYTIQNNWTYEN